MDILLHKRYRGNVSLSYHSDKSDKYIFRDITALEICYITVALETLVMEDEIIIEYNSAGRLLTFKHQNLTIITLV